MWPVSFHFIPASRVDFLEKAEGLEADRLILDLEDGTSASDRNDAVGCVHGFLSRAARIDRVFLRVCYQGNELFLSQQKALFTEFPNLGAVLPKWGDSPERQKQFLSLGSLENSRCIYLVEDLEGLLAIFRCPKELSPYAVGLGLEDFFSNVLADKGDATELVHMLRCAVVLSAARLGSLAIDTIDLDLSGGAEFQNACRLALSCGMNAKFTIHPSQLAATRNLFTPSPEKLQEMVEIAQNFSHNQDSGYTKWNDMVISPPKIRKAHLISRVMDGYPLKP